ncbi:MAG: ABC transporter ATP-binding protein [Deltaproteobacteria bacterium]|nr:ABC transporter ATP-binding protein [Deltaproteobacteria bacterium]
MIEIKDLTKYYGERKAVGPLCVSIAAGEIVGLLGLNGAGKTTTLRLLASDLLPTSGTLLVGGVDLVEEPEKVRPRIGFLPERPPLYDEMDVREFLGFAARLRGVPGRAIPGRVDEVIETTKLGSEAGTRIGALSHGYRQRVGIGQAIVHRPQLLLLDEPIAGLDPVQIAEMRALIRSLGGEHTILLSSHILSEISETCDRLLVIRDGEIVASGSEAELATMLRGGLAVTLVLRAPAGRAEDGVAAVQKLVAALEAVTRVEPLGDGPREGALLMRVQMERDVREHVCRAVVEGGFGVLEMTRSERELESVFMQLTGGGTPRPAGAAEDGESDKEGA